MYNQTCGTSAYWQKWDTCSECSLLGTHAITNKRINLEDLLPIHFFIAIESRNACVSISNALMLDSRHVRDEHQNAEQISQQKLLMQPILNVS